MKFESAQKLGNGERHRFLFAAILVVFVFKRYAVFGNAEQDLQFFQEDGFIQQLHCIYRKEEFCIASFGGNPLLFFFTTGCIKKI